MKCLRCGGRVEEETGVHRYVESGLTNILLVNVPLRRCVDCGARGVVIPRIEQLHRAITALVSTKTERLTAAEIRFLRTCIGLSKEDLAVEFEESPATIAAWEDKAAPITMPLETELRLRIMAATRSPVQRYARHTGAKVAREAPRSPEIRLVTHGRRWESEAVHA